SNRFLMEYWGKLVSGDVAQKIGGRYLFELENGKTIVGTTHKNTARYANHSCRPNAEVRITGNRVFLFSIKPINANEEIVYDYGKEYWNAFIKPKGCLCVPCVKKKLKSTIIF
ncbi:MAG: SET domain-containing protein, partial [Patescibacteria group bacterium]